MRAKWLVLPVVGLLLAGYGGLLVAHTDGIVIPPSHAGQETVTLSDPSATSQAVATTALAVSPPGSGGAGPLLSATLSSLGNPLSGEPVAFYLGATSGGAALCNGTTDAGGVVSCTADESQAGAINSEGFNGDFAGAPGLAPASATWQPPTEGSP